MLTCWRRRIHPVQSIEPLLAAVIAHFWFVTIHPLDDGSGSIARAIAEMVLARAEDSSRRFCSMSAQIRTQQNDYYAMLERTQKSGPDITQRMEWFLTCLDRAIDRAETGAGTVPVSGEPGAIQSDQLLSNSRCLVGIAVEREMRFSMTRG